jgi:alkylation response protein AidB-like acyl-CoA dehydrogenase
MSDYATATQGFLQTVPVLGNQFDDDRVLQGILQRYLPEQVYTAIKPDLVRFGGRVLGDIARMGDEAEHNPPTFRQFDPWCRRVDEIQTSGGWKQLKAVAAEEGLVAIAYERQYGEYSRLYQFAKLYLFVPDSATYGCPLAMTDGAARVLELHGERDLMETAYRRLTTRDASLFWTSGQWMTERPGGSDVSRTETKAIPVDLRQNQWEINGFKWFSSATEADMTLLLARAYDPNTKEFKEGSRGLSLFFAKMRHPDGTLNGIRVHRLKQKYGTKAVPTAELELVGMKGRLLGKLHRGVPSISPILNITRMHCSIAVCGSLRRALAVAKEYARVREAQGKRLVDHPLHMRTLADIELIYRAAMQITFYAISLLGRTECPIPNSVAEQEDRQMFRLITPITKLWTAKHCVAAISEAMEALGGQGYMEDVGITRLLRDAQVNTIWEGTTNILSLDLLRALLPNGALAFQIYTKASHLANMWMRR